MKKRDINYKKMIFPPIGLVPLYSLLMVLSYAIKGEFLYWATLVGISGFFYSFIAIASSLCGLITIVFVCNPIIIPREKLTYEKIVIEQALFFGVALTFLWIFRSSGTEFMTTLLCFGGAFSILAALRWEQNDD